MPNPGKCPCAVVSLVALLLLFSCSAAAETFSHTFNIPGVAQAIAINPVTNKIYIPNGIGDNQIAIIDGATEAVTTVPTGTGINPGVVAVNPVTNKVYVVNQSSGNVSIINGASNAVKNIATGSAPTDLVVNPLTSKIYVLNADSTNNHVNSSVFVIDGALDTVSAPIALLGRAVSGLTLNASRNKIYVSADESSALAGDAFVAAIDGVTNTFTTVNLANPLHPGMLAANPVTGKLYNVFVNVVTVIDGADNARSTIAAGTSPTSVAVNPITGKAYVANSVSNNVTVIDSSGSTAT